MYTIYWVADRRHDPTRFTLFETALNWAIATRPFMSFMVLKNGMHYAYHNGHGLTKYF